MKRFFRCTVFLLFAFSLLSWPVPEASADEVPILSEMTYADQIEFLVRSSVEIPGGEENYTYWKPLIQECISIVENDPAYIFRYNWSVSQDFVMAIQRAVNHYYSITPNFAAKVKSRSVTGLTDSVALADWDASFINYNCYSYALEITTRISRPGDYCGIEPSAPLTLDSVSDAIILDLRSSAFGYSCIKLYTEEESTVLANKTICVRLSENRADYHFMIRDAMEWKHKPGTSAPLKYLYNEVWARDWTNEGLYNGGYGGGGLVYDSEIYYFRARTSHTLSSTYTYTGGHYHMGTFHFYEVQRLCTFCNQYVDGVLKVPCSGPPCDISISSIGDLYIE